MTSELADKPEKFVQSEEGGVRKVEVVEAKRKKPALAEEEAVAIAKLLVRLEDKFERPQDFEWAMENGIIVTWEIFMGGKFRGIQPFKIILLQ